MAEIERAGHGLDPAAGWQRDGSPYHAGEQAVQLRAGTRGKAERMGRRIIRDFMPDQHRAFFAGLPYLIVGSLDGRQRPWASILAGPPGFVQSPDPRLLRVEAKPLIDDPLAANLRQGAPVAFLGIQLDARRRNRMNGHIVDLGDGAVSAAVDQSFGNCPQYIQGRTLVLPSDFTGLTKARSGQKETPILSARATAMIARADTFFIATASPGAGSDNVVEGVDVNHRGGRPGFVKLDVKDGRTMLISPDFPGNQIFSTFGNLQRNPRAGLLFLDFDQGDLLLLTGEAEVIWDGEEIMSFAGAERLLRFRVAEGLMIEGAMPIRWSAPKPAPQIARTGHWTGHTAGA